MIRILLSLAPVACLFPVLAACSDGGAGESRGAEQAIQAVLPGTDIAGINCGKIPGLCEIIAGKNVFYASPDGRYLVVGRIFDTESLQDITEPVLVGLSPERMLSGAVGGVGTSSLRAGREAPSTPTRMDWASLPQDGAVVWGKKGAPRLAVFSDPNCSHCRRLAAALETLDIEVHEYFVNFLGSRPLASAVFCAENREVARREILSGARPVSIPPDCDTSPLDANDSFAAAAGIHGTPFLISEDGRVMPGFPGRQQLLAWLGASN